MTTHNFDFIVLGGGCAGLAIGFYFSQLNAKARIAILDKRQSYSDDRSWCFWLNDSHFVHDDIIYHTWPTWLFSTHKKTVTHQTQSTPYALIKSIDYYNKTSAAIKHDSRQELHLDCEVEAIVEQNNGFQVHTNQGCFKTAKLIDTRPNQAIICQKAPLFQSFYGLEIKTQESIFNPNLAHLMATMRANNNFCQFDYILPFSPQHALIEVTRFSKKMMSPSAIKEDCLGLINNLNAKYETIRHEAAVLPMGIPRQKNRAPHFFNLTQNQGSLRASSGYGFIRLQLQAQALATQIAKASPMLGAQIDTPVDRWMDSCFCRVLTKKMHQAPELFMNMAHALSAENFANFMNGTIDWPLRWEVIKSMPKRPFLQAIL